MDDSSVFYYIGVHSTVGWVPEVTRYLLRGDNYRVALVDYDEERGWKVWHDWSSEASEIAGLFDPESPESKVERCLRRIEARRELKVRGGFIIIDNLARDLEVSDDILKEALEQIVARENGLALTTVRDQRILKRDRMSG